MTLTSQLPLPSELEQYRTVLEPTIQSFIRITTATRPTTLFESKFTGDPYYPKAMSYPTNDNGQPLSLLAQINFADVPKQIPNFPQEGILQFFIDSHDDVYGLNFDNQLGQTSFRIVYHEHVEPDVSKLITDFSFILTSNTEQYLPVEKEMALTFETNYEWMSLGDFRFQKTFPQLLDTFYNNDNLFDLAHDHLAGTGHKLGGYPFFTQEDPRIYKEEFQAHKVLLLQIDSEGNDILWGDCGVGNFFITEEDLRKKDFSKVIYNWDCS